MGMDLVGLKASKKYTQETVLGGGAVVGKNVTISSITEIDGGNRVEFSYTLDDGTVKTSSMIVMDGKTPEKGVDYNDGENGIGISKIEKIRTVDLIDTYQITFSDGNTFEYNVRNGKDGESGASIIEDTATTETDKTWSANKIMNYVNEQIRCAISGGQPTTPILDSITATKVKTLYNVGDTFDTSDIVVTTHYSDGTTKDVTSSVDIDTANVDMSTANTFNISISYTENGITKETNIEITVSAVTSEPEPTITVPQTGTWQLKTTTSKKYITISTDDDNIGNVSFFRLLRTYGFPYTMNVEAENIDKNIGTDDNGTFTNSDAEPLFPNDITVKELGKYLTESGLGEVTQHGASSYNLWDSNNLTGTFLDELYESYTSQGGTRTKDELVSEIKLQLASSDVSQGAVYVEESRATIENAIGHPIYALQTWGGSPIATVDGIKCNLNNIKGGTYDYRAHNYIFASPRVGMSYIATHSLYNKTRNYHTVDIQAEIDKIAIGDIEDFFAHMPYNDLGDEALRQMLDVVKTNVDAGIIEVVTPTQYYNLGEWVDNPITEIKLKRNSNIALGETDDITAYTVIANYEDGTTSDVTAEAIVNNSSINVEEIGNYTVFATYRGFNTTAIVSVIDASYTVPDGLKDKDYWFIFKDDTMNMYFAGNTTGTFGKAGTSSSRLAFTGCTSGKLNGWKSTDGQVWEQSDTNETHYAAIKTTNGSGNFEFNLGASDNITFLETSGNFTITYTA